MEKLLTTVIQLKASDLHISVGQPPVLRQHGRLRRLDLLHDGIEQFGPQQVVGTILHGQNRDVAALFARYQFLGHIVLPFCRIDVTGVDRPFRFEGSLGE